MPRVGVYNVSKAALIHLTRQLGVELGPRVRVNAICPGSIRTHALVSSMEKRDDDLGLPRGTTLDGMNKNHPFGRIGEPEDVANVALFLASDESTWVNGQYIVVSGTGLITSVPK